MNCANCDAVIKDGSIYCPVCGKEAQMVNGYTSLEDDFLHSLLREGIKPEAERKKKTLSKEELLQEQKRKRRQKIVLAGLVFAILFAIGIVVKLFVDYKNDNSYDYQMKMAEEQMIDHNYESALNHLSRALAIIPSDVDSRMQMVEIYLMREEYDSAIVLLSEVIQLDKDNKAAYQYLIDIYDEKGQYEQIQSLSEFVEDKELKKLFADYQVASPIIYPAGDTFYTELYVTILSEAGDEIYYTIDGTDPIANGERYISSVGIQLNNSGLYMVRAVCKNANNIYSEVTKRDYQIILLPPEDATENTEAIENAETIEEIGIVE